jgi:UDP-glucose 4-epimerase
MIGPDPTGHRVLLTGSTGTLGHHISLQLQKLPRTQILAVHRRPHEGWPVHPRLRHQIVNFSRKRELAALFSRFKPTCVIHCAADGMIFPQGTWFKLMRFNVDSTLHLVELAAGQPNCHFIHVSTGLAYRNTGRPLVETDALDNLHPYGASKASADILLRSACVEFKLPLTVFRPFSFTGVNDVRTRLFPSILRAAAEERPLGLSPGDQVRDFCSARDIARAALLALPHPPAVMSPGVYNLGSGQALTVRQLTGQIVDELEIPVQLKFGERPYDIFEPMHLVADIARARRELKWRPQHRLAHAVWQLAKVSFPALKLKKPRELL